MIVFGILKFIMLLAGIVFLIKGEIRFARVTRVLGSRARLIGVIMMLPYLLSFLAGFAKGFIQGASDNRTDQYDPLIDWISHGSLAACLVLSVILFGVWSKRQSCEAGL